MLPQQCLRRTGLTGSRVACWGAVLTCVLFVWATFEIRGQTVTTSRTRAGQFHTEVEGDAISIHFGGVKWKIDRAALPFLPSDCSPEAEGTNRSISPDLSGCGHSPTEVGSTVSPPRIFFTLWTGTYAQNVPHILFEADVARHTIRRLLGADSGIGDLLISPSGRRFAYTVGWSSGVCHHTSSVFVADLGVPSKATGPASVAAVDVASPHMLGEPVRWASDERLVFREATFESDNSCKLDPWHTKTALVGSLQFR